MLLSETFQEINFELEREIPSLDKKEEVVTELIDSVFTSCISYLTNRYGEIYVLPPILGMFVAYKTGQLEGFQEKLMEFDTERVESIIATETDKIGQLQISFEEEQKVRINLRIKPEKLKGEFPWENQISSMQA